MDVDLASPLPPETVMQVLTAAGVKVVPTGLAHGTVTAVLANRSVEITTLRRDVETDGRHAVVAFTDDWREDAARRDFTINAMSMTRDGAVFDYFGGVEDLRAGRLRFVGDPAARVAEDYLRVLRFFRFFARYAAVAPEAATLAALQGGVPQLGSLSAERVWHELTLVMAAPDPIAAVVLMDQLGVLAAVVPEGTDVAALAQMIGRGAPADALLRLAALLTGDVLAFAARLKLSAAERDRLLALRAAPLATPEDDDAALRRLLADTPAEVLVDRTWLSGGEGTEWSLLRERLRTMPVPGFPWKAATSLLWACPLGRASARCCARSGAGGWPVGVSQMPRRAEKWQSGCLTRERRGPFQEISICLSARHRGNCHSPGNRNREHRVDHP